MARKIDELGDINLNDFDYESEESFSLESILAEYKGAAYIEGEKKTPSDILDDETEKIIREVLDGETFDSEDKTPEETDEVEKIIREEKAERKAGEKKHSFYHKSDPEDRYEFEKKEQSYDPYDKSVKAEKTYKNEEVYEEDDEDPCEEKKPFKLNFEFFKRLKREDAVSDEEYNESDENGEYKYSSSNPDASYAEYDDDDEDTYIEHINLADRIAGFLNRKSVEYKDKRAMAEAEYEDSFDDEEEEPYVPEEEPEYKDEAKRFIQGLTSLALREMIIFPVMLLALTLNILFELNISIPFGIGHNQYLITGILLILQLVSMALGVEILISGISDLAALKPGAETLVTLSAVVNFIDALVIILKKDMSVGLPYSIVTICAIYFAVLGRKSYRLAMAESFKAAVASSNPSALVLDDENIEGKFILKKVKSDLSGFWRMATSSDIAEDAFGYISPILIISSVLLAFFSVFLKNEVSIFLHSVASMLSVSASFSSVIAYALPFRLFTKKMRSAGGVIAGWRGAVEICNADGALIVDNDIFPKGTVTLTGVKVFEGVQASRAIGYTGSIVIKSQSGLTDVFDDFMRTKGINKVSVEQFSFYEGGGLGGRIFGENVLVGSAGFMNLMGIRVPNSVFEKNALYTAVNSRVIATFSLSYTPSNSVRKAMFLLLKSKISMFFAAKDANLTPNMLQQKFKVSVDGIEYIPIEDCYRISSEESSETKETLGIAYRSGLGPFASIISNSKKLVSLSTLLTMISVISSIVGLTFVFLLCWSGTFVINTPMNLLIYMMLIQAVVYVLIALYCRK